MIKVGTQVPDFKLQNQDAKWISRSDLLGRWFILYVYPKDDTPGCTIQGKAFTASKDQFAELGVSVFGLSEDDVDSHKAFCNKFSFKIDLLADPQKTLLKALGVGQTEWNGNMYWDRSTFVIDPKGVVKKVYEKVSAQGHEQVLLQALNEFVKKA